MFQAYIFIILLCLTVSIYLKTPRQRGLWIYFFIIFTIENLIYFKYLKIYSYNWANLLYLIFFYGYYYKEIVGKKSYFIILWIISCLLCLYFIFKENIFGGNLNIFQSLVYIFLSMNWFIQQIKAPDNIRIYKKMSFWISISILLWSITFLFRIIPMYFFANNDIGFLEIVNRAYQGVTMFTYILMFRGLLCEK